MSRALRIAYRQTRRRVSKTFFRVPVIWYRHRNLTERDVFVAAYARTGSVWLRFLLYEILAHDPATFDVVNRNIPDVGGHGRSLALLPSGGRVLKTHEPYRKEYAKAIYMVRDPRDVILSEYAFYKQSRRIDYTFDEFFHLFLQGKSNGYGPWAGHVRSWLRSPIAENKNLLVIRFEDLKKQTESSLGRIVNFLGVEADTLTIRRAIANNTVARMREKETEHPQLVTREGHHYIRSGSVGGWRENLSHAEVKLIEQHAGEVLAQMGYESAASRTESQFTAL
jgi:Sulfotransferase domain